MSAGGSSAGASIGVSSGSIRTLAQDAETSHAPRTLKVPCNRDLSAIAGVNGAVMGWALKSEADASLDECTLLLELCVAVLLLLCSGFCGASLGGSAASFALSQ